MKVFKIILVHYHQNSTASKRKNEYFPSAFRVRYLLNKQFQPAQQDNFDTSLSNAKAANFKPSAIVK